MEEEKKVRKKTTSAMVRNKWNSEHYNRINVTIPKGYGEIFREYCNDRNTTMNALLTSIIKLELDKWHEKKESQK